MSMYFDFDVRPQFFVAQTHPEDYLAPRELRLGLKWMFEEKQYAMTFRFTKEEARGLIKALTDKLEMMK